MRKGRKKRIQQTERRILYTQERADSPGTALSTNGPPQTDKQLDRDTRTQSSHGYRIRNPSMSAKSSTNNASRIGMRKDRRMNTNEGTWGSGKATKNRRGRSRGQNTNGRDGGSQCRRRTAEATPKQTTDQIPALMNIGVRHTHTARGGRSGRSIARPVATWTEIECNIGEETQPEYGWKERMSVGGQLVGSSNKTIGVRRSKVVRWWSLNQIGHVHGHFFNRRVIERLDLTHRTHILVRHEVDGDTFPTEATRSTDTVNIVFSVAWEVIVDDE